MRKRIFTGWIDKNDPVQYWAGECWTHLKLRLWKHKRSKEDCTGWPPVHVKVTIEEVKA